MTWKQKHHHHYNEVVRVLRQRLNVVLRSLFLPDKFVFCNFGKQNPCQGFPKCSPEMSPVRDLRESWPEMQMAGAAPTPAEPKPGEPGAEGTCLSSLPPGWDRSYTQVFVVLLIALAELCFSSLGLGEERGVRSKRAFAFICLGVQVASQCRRLLFRPGSLFYGGNNPLTYGFSV